MTQDPELENPGCTEAGQALRESERKDRRAYHEVGARSGSGHLVGSGNAHHLPPLYPPVSRLLPRPGAGMQRQQASTCRWTSVVRHVVVLCRGIPQAASRAGGGSTGSWVERAGPGHLRGGEVTKVAGATGAGSGRRDRGDGRGASAPVFDWCMDGAAAKADRSKPRWKELQRGRQARSCRKSTRPLTQGCSASSVADGSTRQTAWSAASGSMAAACRCIISCQISVTLACMSRICSSVLEPICCWTWSARRPGAGHQEQRGTEQRRHGESTLWAPPGNSGRNEGLVAATWNPRPPGVLDSRPFLLRGFLAVVLFCCCSFGPCLSGACCIPETGPGAALVKMDEVITRNSQGSF